MKTIALTGFNGFLGWHVRVATHSLGFKVVPVAVGDKFNQEAAIEALSEADTLIHLAGVNRAVEESIVRNENVRFAEQLASVIATVDNLKRIVYANSTQAGNGTPYGEGKEIAGKILATVADAFDLAFANHHLPNLFGEHGAPFYNSVVATFCHLVANNKAPEVHQDAELTLLHAQDAADILLNEIELPDWPTEVQSVSNLATIISGMGESYRLGEIPDVGTPFRRNLFNTYRSFLTASFPQVTHTQHSDSRGSFVEVIRTHGGTGQSSFSTTEPGILRGGHYHRRKIERFTVLAGTALIELRRLFSTEKVSIMVSGNNPVSVDMPTMWTHNIRNVGVDTLFTHFWTDDHFNPNNPDTFMEDV